MEGLHQFTRNAHIRSTSLWYKKVTHVSRSTTPSIVSRTDDISTPRMAYYYFFFQYWSPSTVFPFRFHSMSAVLLSGFKSEACLWKRQICFYLFFDAVICLVAQYIPYVIWWTYSLSWNRNQDKFSFPWVNVMFILLKYNVGHGHYVFFSISFGALLECCLYKQLCCELVW